MRIGHIAQAWLIVASVMFITIIAADDLDDAAWFLVAMLVYAAGLLFYSSSVRRHRGFNPYKKSGMLDDDTIMLDGTHRVATLPVFTIVVGVILLFGSVMGLIPSVGATIGLSDEIGRDVRYNRDFDGREIIGAFLAFATCLTGVCSLVFVSTSIGQRVMKPVEASLQI